MKHIIFGSNTQNTDIAILIKTTCFTEQPLRMNYLDPIPQVPANRFIAFDLAYQANNKAPAKFAKAYLQIVLPELKNLNIKTVLVCDPAYFKYLTNNRKSEPFYGYVCPCTLDGYTNMNIILCPNYQAVLYNPNQQAKIDIALQTLSSHMIGKYTVPGTGIIHSAYYPSTLTEITEVLKTLHKYPKLTCDLEGLSLEFWNCGISTISFAWDKHNGIAFAVDRNKHNIKEIRQILKKFLQTFKGTLIYHNANFDLKILVYNLYMKYLGDYPQMITGIQQLAERIDDTKLIVYMATNNAVQNKLGLKEVSAEFTGNYAQEDIKDTSKIPLPELLEYNLTDCLATWYVHDKYKPIMIKDNQEVLYETLMKSSIKTLLQTELCGMPISPVKVQIAKKELEKTVNTYLKYFQKSKKIKAFHKTQIAELIDTKTAAAVKKVYTENDSIIKRFVFNPNSDTQLRNLIYDYWGYTVIDKTKSKQPATGAKTLKKLINHAKSKTHKKIFKNLTKLSQANIILTTFIPAFENAQQLPDGSWRLFGNFNLGGTQSLRLSSSKPNLQNIPSHSFYAKLIKACFISTLDWIFMGSDFDALEDKMGALLSQDPNKLKVYTDGFDGHCLRAFTYYDLDKKGIKNTVKSINSIEKIFPKERQESKNPTFALSYKGTWITLVNNCGFTKVKAKEIESKYHVLYKVADAWLADLIEKAETCGYIPLAFGGKIRTPLIARSIGGTSATPYIVQAEARSAGNAATQSYCSLTMRAFNEFLIERVWNSPYKYLILPAGTIHDAIYLLVANQTKVIKWVNDNLIDCMAWQGLPEIQHPTIKISSGMEIYFPSWKNKVSIPNDISAKEIKIICRKVEKKLK